MCSAVAWRVCRLNAGEILQAGAHALRGDPSLTL